MVVILASMMVNLHHRWRAHLISVAAAEAIILAINFKDINLQIANAVSHVLAVIHDSGLAEHLHCCLAPSQKDGSSLMQAS
jgi:hypothetical protein